MTFRQFALNNVLRNKRVYVAYFLSSLFTVMVFFTFAVFAFHPALTGDDMNNNVTFGMLTAGGIIYVFSFFFILYSMGAFLYSRRKEFGVLIIQGMSSRQIRWMVFLENMFIGFFATAIGIGIGFLFTKVILLIAENVLVMEQSLSFYFPTMALVITFVSFIVLFLCISIFVTFILRTKKLVTLIKGNKIEKGEPKASIFFTVIAIVLLTSGYTIALKVDAKQVVFAFIPVVLLVTIGTYFLFTQLSVFVIRRLKSRKFIFWKKTNMLLFSDLSYRMKDNARVFFMVAIISTVAFTAIGTLIGVNSYLTKEMRQANPISFIYFGEEDEDILKIEDTIDEHHITIEKANIELTYFELGDGEHELIVSEQTYNNFARIIGEKIIELPKDEIIVVQPSTRNLFASQFKHEEMSITMPDGTTHQPNKELFGIAKPDILPTIEAYFIAGDDLFSELGVPSLSSKTYAWQVVEGKENDIIKAGEILSEDFQNNGEFAAIDYMIYEIKKLWSPVMLVGLFIGIVFFVSAGSFLYFRLYSDLDDDKGKFIAISKIGLTREEMRKVIGRQITILFFLPIIVALAHGAVALTTLAHMFSYNLVRESAIVLGSFFIIQVVYYMVVRFFYTRQVERAVY